jgi:hypothetical protein
MAARSVRASPTVFFIAARLLMTYAFAGPGNVWRGSRDTGPRADVDGSRHVAFSGCYVGQGERRTGTPNRRFKSQLAPRRGVGLEVQGSGLAVGASGAGEFRYRSWRQGPLRTWPPRCGGLVASITTGLRAEDGAVGRNGGTRAGEVGPSLGIVWRNPLSAMDLDKMSGFWTNGST